MTSWRKSLPDQAWNKFLLQKIWKCRKTTTRSCRRSHNMNVIGIRLMYANEYGLLCTFYANRNANLIFNWIWVCANIYFSRYKSRSLAIVKELVPTIEWYVCIWKYTWANSKCAHFSPYVVHYVDKSMSSLAKVKYLFRIWRVNLIDIEYFSNSHASIGKWLENILLWIAKQHSSHSFGFDLTLIWKW